MKKRPRLTLSISGIAVLLAASAWSMHLHYLYDGTEAWNNLLIRPFAKHQLGNSRRRRRSYIP